MNIEQNTGMGNGIKKGLEYAIESKNYKNFGWTHADLQIPQESNFFLPNKCLLR